MRTFLTGVTPMRNRVHLWAVLAIALLSVAVLPGCNNKPAAADGAAVELLNVSYDPTREFYADYNAAFADEWRTKTGQMVTVKMSHGGSGKQARAVIDGLAADVVTLALAYDIDMLAEKGRLLPPDWQKSLPNNSSPYTSTIVFLVRKGNPKHIKDWDDLVKDDVQVITPNPKTSGGARWNYLAAWGYKLKKELGDFSKLKQPNAPEVVAAQQKAEEFVKVLFQHVPVLDTGARSATLTFVDREIGDVLLAWENEALRSVELGPDKVEIVVPPLSILAEPPVAVVDANVEKHGTKQIAVEYANFLYSPRGQAIAAKNFYRPRKAEGVPEELLKRFSKAELFTVDDVFGGWKAAQAKHFDENGAFDQITKKSE
jgi:sulfate/thiosulfate transport system substrate-binding protein